MDINDIIKLLPDMGLTIFLCSLLFKHLKERESVSDSNNLRWMEIVNNNTEIMRSVTEKLDFTIRMIEHSLYGNGANDDENGETGKKGN